ncbi:MAG: ATP-binding cassette domain-containing protein, partial [Desulfatitalea sp.]|nr:ATP-binding cassette domain-containing protein [Desulfatitalea sp.]
ALSFRHTPESPWLFRDVDLVLTPGEIVGLYGPSGSGKTTLARIVSGYLRPASGQVGIDGLPPMPNGFSKIQLLFQHPELAINPRWKIRKVLCEGYRPGPRRLAAFEIAPRWLERYPCELSGGQLSRICLVRALGPAVRYLIADEITTMLDALTQARIWKSLLQYSEENRIGILVISHDTALLKRLCHRTIRFPGWQADG